MNTLRTIACLSMWLLLVSTTIAQEKKPLAIEDLYLMESVKSPMLFPSPPTPLPKGEGKQVEKLVYERVWIDAKTKQERHSLWLVTEKRENRKPLEKDEPDGRNPVVSPDGKWIAFLSTRPRGDGWKQAPSVPAFSDVVVDIWLYDVGTDKVMPLGGPKKPWGRVFHDGFYGRVAFSADSKNLVFVADDGKDPRTKEEIENDVEIVRPDQGEGYTGYGPAQVWVAELAPRGEVPRTPGFGVPHPGASTIITRVTDDGIWYGDPQWSPDGKSLVVVANKTKDRESVRFSINKNFDLYQIDIATKKQTQLTTNPGPDVSPRISPDGKQIAYLSVPRNGPHRDVFELSVATQSASGVQTRTVNIAEYSPSYPLGGDCWEDSNSIRVAREQRAYDIVTMRDIQSGKWLSNRNTVSPRFLALYPFGDRLPDDRFEGRSHVVTWQNEGFKVEGHVTLPALEIAKPPYKLVVYPHGGPHSRSTDRFDFTVQLFAAHGYAVFQPNFRGSSGYGKTFLDADRLDLGGGDMRDILTGIDKLVKDGLVDPKRQFVYGISYGGFMASWLVGHTHQFKAAVAQNAVTDMNMMYGLSDLQSWTTWELGGLPWEQPERYRKHSPITYANKVKTPTLILHARDDRRCPLPMGKAFHQALLANGVDTQMVIYPNEGHGIRQPRHREDVYRRVLAWFAKHDK